jgi:hypothetical protein
MKSGWRAGYFPRIAEQSANKRSARSSSSIQLFKVDPAWDANSIT